MIVVVCRRGFAFEYRVVVVVVVTILPSRCVGVILHGAVLFRFLLGVLVMIIFVGCYYNYDYARVGLLMGM